MSLGLFNSISVRLARLIVILIVNTTRMGKGYCMVLGFGHWVVTVADGGRIMVGVTGLFSIRVFRIGH